MNVSNSTYIILGISLHAAWALLPGDSCDLHLCGDSKQTTNCAQVSCPSCAAARGTHEPTKHTRALIRMRSTGKAGLSCTLGQPRVDAPADRKHANAGRWLYSSTQDLPYQQEHDISYRDILYLSFFAPLRRVLLDHHTSFRRSGRVDGSTSTSRYLADLEAASSSKHQDVHSC
jgi:hypothetical protein